VAPPPTVPAAVRWDGTHVHLLDQTRLPHAEEWVTPADTAQLVDAIRRLVVRGAPNIGIAAAYGLAAALARSPSLGTLEEAADALRDARPTAVNLAYAVERVRAAALAAGPARMAAAARTEAEAIDAQEIAAARALGGLGADLLQELVPGARLRILTHCNTGALATAGAGSGLGVIATLAARGVAIEVLACETRPLLQGARLTAWELGRLGIPHAVLVDGAAAGLLARGEIEAVIVGCDRVARNGDTANKVGTYGHALAAAAHDVPFLVAGPVSTIDPHLPSGSGIEIEERPHSEVTGLGGVAIAPAGTPARNPAFDVTPASLITALVTERGVARPVDAAGVGALLDSAPVGERHGAAGATA
jgi:methylthioribose-1-phosphate isomerase